MEIQWLGSPNFDSRGPYIPFVIVKHISAGMFDSMTSWFHNPKSRASSNFGIRRDGFIGQYVKIQDRAWTQGLHNQDEIANAPSPIVRQMGCNPNYYCVSTEYEAYDGHGLQGDVTEEQFWAGLWLDAYIKSEVEKLWGKTMILNQASVIGHYQIDPVDRPNDPGPKFPWNRYYQEYPYINQMSFEAYEERLKYLISDSQKRSAAFSLAERVTDLDGKLTGQWASESERKLLLLTDVYLITRNDDKPPTAGNIVNDVKDLYKKAISNSQWNMDAVIQLKMYYDLAKKEGIL